MSFHRVVLDWTMLNSLSQNVLHFLNPDGALSPEGIRDEILNNWMPTVRNVQNANGRWSQIKIYNLSSPGDAPFVHVIPSPGQKGSLDGPMYHPSVCILVSVRTGVGGPHGHGRFYLPGLHYDWVENGQLRVDIVDYVQGFMNNLVGKFKSGGTRPITLGVSPRSSPVDFLSMTNLIVRRVCGIQRRRNIGVGI